MKRRHFIKLTAATAASIPFLSELLSTLAAEERNDLFEISLAEWSLNQTLKAGKLDNLDFAKVAKREFGIDTIEYVDQFFRDKAKDMAYLKDLKSRAESEGVKIHLIMLDTNGPLGATEKADRDKAVAKTFEWIDAAKFLGCSSIRVNAHGTGSPEELKPRIVESCSRLADYAAQQGMNVLIENHGGPSSNAEWLTSVFKAVNKPNFGALPDFGNFTESTNRYDAVEMMMPYAKAVSAKAMKFTGDGQVVETDYRRMMRIVRDGGYPRYVGIESAPGKQDLESKAIIMTRDLLKKIREEQKLVKPIFNGRDLSGWTKIEGGEWTVRDGILVGRNGINWSTNPEKTGSWLSTEKQYGDFRLELQFTLTKGSNSGIFFRSSHEKNPAFTGYEMQIHDSPGRPASKTGPGSIYDTVAPTKNLIRPAGEWNSVTIIGRGPKIEMEMNGEKTMETELSRSLKGYLGLQNHDAKSEVRFRNIRVQEL